MVANMNILYRVKSEKEKGVNRGTGVWRDYVTT